MYQAGSGAGLDLPEERRMRIRECAFNSRALPGRSAWRGKQVQPVLTVVASASALPSSARHICRHMSSANGKVYELMKVDMPSDQQSSLPLETTFTHAVGCDVSDDVAPNIADSIHFSTSTPDGTVNTYAFQPVKRYSWHSSSTNLPPCTRMMDGWVRCGCAGRTAMALNGCVSGGSCRSKLCGKLSAINGDVATSDGGSQPMLATVHDSGAFSYMFSE